MARREICILGALVIAGAIWVGCGDEDVEAQLNQVNDFVQGVGTSDGLGLASLRSGDAPGETGGPSISESTEAASVITGGSVSVPVSTSEGEFTAVIVYVEGASDYYEVSLGSAVQSTELVLTIGQDVPSDTFTVRYALVDAGGLVGPYWGASLSVQDVGAESPDVQVALSWDVDSDLDLMLTDANGEIISFANRTTSTGGSLDLDSNRGCTIDGIRNESISYPSGAAPGGQYTAQVLLSGACGTESTKYILTILLAGESPEIHVGTISGEFVPADHQYRFSFGTAGEDCTGIPVLTEEELGAVCDTVEGGCPNGVCVGGLCHQACDPDRCTGVCGENDCVVAASDSGTGESTDVGPPRQVEAAGVCELPEVVPAVETNCANEVDDDDDGYADCLDPDCSADPACAPTTEIDCANEVDDDDDGYLDCEDPDCSDDAACLPSTETSCTDGVDNDRDTYQDCDDPDCSDDLACCDMAGAWDGTITDSEIFPSGETFDLDLTQEGSSLSGSLIPGLMLGEMCGVYSSTESVVGAVDGSSISFATSGYPVMSFTGTRASCESAAGTMTFDGGICMEVTFDWTLTRSAE